MESTLDGNCQSAPETVKLLDRPASRFNSTSQPEDSSDNFVDFADYLMCGSCFGRPQRWRLTEAEANAMKELQLASYEPYEPEVHDRMLDQLWSLVFPDDDVPPRIDDAWKKLGFQSHDPRTDLRTGVQPLKNMIYFASHYTEACRSMVRESLSPAACYPFGAVCVNVSFLLVMFFELLKGPCSNPLHRKIVATPRQKKEIARLLSQFSVFQVGNEAFCGLLRKVHAKWLFLVKEEGADLRSFSRALEGGLEALGEALDFGVPYPADLAKI